MYLSWLYLWKESFESNYFFSPINIRDLMLNSHY